ncbi:hypothetical protein [Bremerella sp. P1]|uniref:hypothetical protein n=1 Tax=Bremerella sp. P1 TaxID=3026424 RepID=UPI0023681F8B|nr:hypothetical protein [Bremerella sp. P1]WDI42663.1 hypothetical protein PSR63_01720 [Bremerella sp. P1]
MRYLNANLDPTFTEVDRLIGNDPRAESLDQFKRADVLNNVFGVACDKDSKGHDFHIGLKARCTHCKQRKIIVWESIEPPKYVEKEVPHVTHETWSALKESEKQSLISTALDKSSLA